MIFGYKGVRSLDRIKKKFTVADVRGVELGHYGRDFWVLHGKTPPKNDFLEISARKHFARTGPIIFIFGL